MINEKSYQNINYFFFFYHKNFFLNGLLTIILKTSISISFVKITRHNKDVAIYNYGLRTKNRTKLTHVLHFSMKFNKYYQSKRNLINIIYI